MNDELKMRLFQAIASGGLRVTNLILENTGSLYFNDYGTAEVQRRQVLSREAIGRAVKAVQDQFWGNSSYAIIFCGLRDCFYYTVIASIFESTINELKNVYSLDYACPQNTIYSTFHNNTYLQLPVDKWEANHVKPRSVLLVKAFRTALERELDSFR